MSVSIGMLKQNLRKIRPVVIELEPSTGSGGRHKEHGGRHTQSDRISLLEHSSKGLIKIDTWSCVTGPMSYIYINYAAYLTSMETF